VCHIVLPSGLVFQNAIAFTNNTFFCSGSWEISLFQPSDMQGSGVTDFACENDNVLRSTTEPNNIQKAVNDWIDGSSTEKDAVIAKYGEIEEWDVSRVGRMDDLFQGKTSFNADLSKWNVTNVRNMDSSRSFFFISIILYFLDLKFDHFAYLHLLSFLAFQDAKLFNSDLSKWRVNKVTTMVESTFILSSSLFQCHLLHT